MNFYEENQEGVSEATSCKTSGKTLVTDNMFKMHSGFIKGNLTYFSSK